MNKEPIKQFSNCKYIHHCCINSNNLLTTGRKPPKCDICNKTFEISRDLRDHGVNKKKKEGSHTKNVRRNNSKLKGASYFRFLSYL